MVFANPVTFAVGLIYVYSYFLHVALLTHDELCATFSKFDLLCTIHVFHALHVRYIPYMYMYMVRSYAYGMAVCTICVWYEICIQYTT